MNTLNFWQRAVAVSLLVVTPMMAHSAAVVCEGTVATLSYHGPGVVYLQLSSMNTGVGICSVDTNWSPPGSQTGITTPAACKLMYASLLAAKMSGTVVRSVYFDSDTAPSTCTQFVAWSQANLRHFAL